MRSIGENSPEGVKSISTREWNKYRNKLMNALSGIMGSTELLSTSNANSIDSGISKYYGVIQRNSERIKTLTSDFENGVLNEIPVMSRTDRAKQLEEIITG